MRLIEQVDEDSPERDRISRFSSQVEWLKEAGFRSVDYIWAFVDGTLYHLPKIKTRKRLVLHTRRRCNTPIPNPFLTQPTQPFSHPLIKFGDPQALIPIASTSPKERISCITETILWIELSQDQ